LFVFLAFSYQWYFGADDDWSKLLVMLGFAVSVFGSGVRTLRGAYEFGRNASRFRAKYYALVPLAERLSAGRDAPAIFHDLWYCEQILESEHREWLRLMIEAK
jgi:hypothetical protein